MRLQIKHVTQYDFEAPVDYALQKVRLRPLPSAMQSVETWDVDVEGGRIEASYLDHYGNHVDLVSADAGGRKLVLTAQGIARTEDNAGILGKVYGTTPLWHFRQSTTMTTAGDRIKELAGTVDADLTTPGGLHRLSAAILQAVPYTKDATGPGTSAEEAALGGAGVCQDHANILVAAARHLGLPARYVSGYLLMTDRVDQDASHGWAEVHLDDLGWVGFDVSNGVSPDERYLRIAIGRDAQDATPISGLRVGRGDEAMIVSLQVQQ